MLTRFARHFIFARLLDGYCGNDVENRCLDSENFHRTLSNRRRTTTCGFFVVLENLIVLRLYLQMT
jgi:hypothetical protein